MNNNVIHEIISKYMSKTLSRASSRFIKTKKDNLLESTVDIYHYRESIHISCSLYNFDNLYEIRSLNEIQFIFENEYLIDAVLSLTKKQQVLIYYKYFEDLTDKEIAKKMHTTRQAVTSLKHYTLHKLRESLENTKQMWR